jgi:hypothetical protein
MDSSTPRSKQYLHLAQYCCVGSKVPQLQYIYRLNLLLADDSGHMTAQLAGAEAVSDYESAFIAILNPIHSHANS